MASILSAQLMMEWFARKHNDKSAKEAANLIDKAVDITLKEGKVRTYDLGGSSKTYEVGDEIVKKVSEIKK